MYLYKLQLHFEKLTNISRYISVKLKKLYLYTLDLDTKCNRPMSGGSSTRIESKL